MKHLQSFNERKFYTIKNNNQELTINDIKNGEWSLTDHLNPKIDSLINSLNDIKNRSNIKGAKVYTDEADKIDQMYKILHSEIIDEIEEVNNINDIQDLDNDISDFN